MKKFADKLTTEFNRRKTDKMCLCEKITHWWKEEWKFRWIILNAIIVIFIASFLGVLYYKLLETIFRR